MTLPRMAIRRAVTATMLYFIVLGFGLFSLARLKLALYPDITFPVVAIITRYQGAGPSDIETTVTRPIEQTVVSVEDVESVTSTSRKGLSFVILEFDWGKDMDQAQTDVTRALEWVSDILPPDATNPLVFAFDPSQMPIIFLGVSSPTLDQAALRQIAVDQVQPRLERVVGVAAADVIGGLERQIRVEIDPRALASYGLTFDQVVGSLRAANLQVPGGVIRDGRTAFSVRTLGEYRSIDEIRQTIVTARNGQVIHVDDVADVNDSYAERVGETRVNRAPGLVMIVRKQSDANTVQTVEKVNEALPDIVATVPAQIALNPIFDQAEFINQSISNLARSGLWAFLLTVGVLLLFLRNLRSSFVVAVSIPMSVIATFFVMDLSGTTLNIISMAGLALAIGMLVDNAIVVLENIYRHRELGYDAIDAADKGSTQVGMAITASTLTTLAIFLPVLFVPGIAGVMFNDMVVTITISLAMSLLVALTLVPLMASRMLKKEHREPHGRISRPIYDAVGNRLVALDRFYTNSLKWSLRHRWTVICSVIGSLVVSAVALAVFVGVDFFPKTDEGQFSFTVEHAVGTDLPTTMRTVRAIEDYLHANVPEAAVIYATAGSEGTLGNIFRGLDTNSGAIQVKLTPRSERNRSQQDIEDQVRGFLETIPGIRHQFEAQGGMPGGGSAIEVKLFGENLERSAAVADKYVEAFKKIPGAVDVRSNLEKGAPELQIELDRARLQAVGLTAGQVTNAISTAFQGIDATRYRESGKEYQVFVRLRQEFRASPVDLEELMISTPTGAQVPLRQIADIRREVAPVAITRVDQSRVVIVSMNTAGRDLGGVVTDLKAAMAKIEVPPDIVVEIGGSAEDQQESFAYLGLAILAGIILVFMVMASQFESFVDPFIIMFTIPLAFIGVALALIVTGTSLSLMALIGMLILVGVVVNNGIVLVDFINQLRRNEGMGLHEAVVEGARARLRPVLMTALTTTMGMFPLALGTGESGETWAPLARAVMGGLTVATVLTLIVVPIIYTFVEALSGWYKRKRGIVEETEERRTAETRYQEPIEEPVPAK